MDQELAKEVSADQITLIVAGVTLAPPHYSEVYREWACDEFQNTLKALADGSPIGTGHVTVDKWTYIFPLILADAPPPRDR